MNSKIKKSKSAKAIPFPKLMICDASGVVVLMSREKTGVVVHAKPDARYPLGDTDDTWDMDYFRDFTGTITLSN